MKVKLIFGLVVTLGVLIVGCKQEEKKEETKEVHIDLINDEFPEAKREVMETYETIAQILKQGDMDKLIALHAYSPKFTEFKNGELRNDGKANESYERRVFSTVTEVVKFDSNDLKIAVYGDVANVTFHSDFHFKFGEDLVIVNDQITLLFVKTENGWKIVHEHHSPLKNQKN